MDDKTSLTRRASIPIPVVPAVPLIGNAWEFRYRTLALFLRTLSSCGALGTIRIGPKQLTLINAPEYVGAVLVDHSDRIRRVPFVTQVLEPLVGHGLIVSDAATHRQQRALMAPAFQHRRISTYAESITEYTEQLQRGWYDGATVDVAVEMMQLTLWIIGKTLFDADFQREASGVGQAFTIVVHTLTANATALAPFLNLRGILHRRQFHQALHQLDDLVGRLITERRETGEDQGDVLSMLLAAQDEVGRRMSNQQVRDEVMTLLSAGHETTANALAWTWYLLMQHPTIYARVREEGDQVLSGRTPTMDDLAKLPYTLQVFKESLRLYPPAYIIVRKVVQPIHLGPYTLSPGMNVGISPYVLHRNPAYFPDPDRFDPDRWTPEHEAKLPRYAYLPFGAGPHICIGNHFAMMEAHLMLATLAQRVLFDLVPGQTIEPEPLITLRPKDGIRAAVRRRERMLGPDTRR